MADPAPPAGAGERFLVVRLSSLGDIVHALPAVAALRDSFPGARLDWVVDRRWSALLEGSPVLDERIALDGGSWRGLRACAARLRAGGYTCAVDFQGLYKSALLARFSGAPRRVGFGRGIVREGGAAFFYTQRIFTSAVHIVEQNLALAQAAGAWQTACRFSLRTPPEAKVAIEARLAAQGIRDCFVLSPGGGWKSKCWPAERYGVLCRELDRCLGWRAVVNYGPGEDVLAGEVCRAAAPATPLRISTSIPELMALLERAKFLVAGDSGPLHLAVALGTPVVGLYGPTDPARNGPYNSADVVVRNAQPSETSYKRGREYAPSMLSISVEQVVVAVKQRLGMRT